MQYHFQVQCNTSFTSTVFGDLYGSCAMISQPFSRAQLFTAVVSVCIMVDFSKFVLFNSLPCMGMTIMTFVSLLSVATNNSPKLEHRNYQHVWSSSVPGVSRKGSMACPPLPFNPITCYSPLHFCLCSYLLRTARTPFSSSSFCGPILHIPTARAVDFIIALLYIWTHSLPHPQAYVVFMAVHCFHHRSIRSGMFVLKIRWGLLVIIMGIIKQVSATNWCVRCKAIGWDFDRCRSE